MRIANALGIDAADLLPSDDSSQPSPFEEIEKIAKTHIGILEESIEMGISPVILRSAHRRVRDILKNKLKEDPEVSPAKNLPGVAGFILTGRKIDQLFHAKGSPNSVGTIPVYSITRTSEKNNPDTIRKVTEKAPCPSLIGVPDAYGIYMPSNHMEPRYKQGWLLFINPYKPAPIGRDIFVSLKSGIFLIAELQSETDEEIIIKQLNPLHSIALEKPRLTHWHLVVGSDQEA
jgi:hypothetical protein